MKITTPPSAETALYDIGVPDFDYLVDLRVIIAYPDANGTNYIQLNYSSASGAVITGIQAGKLRVASGISSLRSKPATVILEYTKTTDGATKTVAVPLSTMTIETPSYQSAAASTVTTKFEA